MLLFLIQHELVVPPNQQTIQDTLGGKEAEEGERGSAQLILPFSQGLLKRLKEKKKARSELGANASRDG